MKESKSCIVDNLGFGPAVADSGAIRRLNA